MFLLLKWMVRRWVFVVGNADFRSRTEVQIPAHPDVSCLTVCMVEASDFITSA